MPLATTGESIALTALLASRFVSLHTGVPTGGNEVSGGSYARQSASFSQTGDNPTTAANDATIEFPVASAAWGNVTHVGIYSAASAGDLIAYEEIDVAKNIGIGDVFRFVTGELKVTAD